MATPDPDLALALTLADLADEITMRRFGALDLRVETKPDMSPVSEADTAVERALRERLAVERPEDAILGEEFGAQEPAAGGRRWIIDPIDGTKGYVRGVPVWATLIALEVAGEPVLGVASAPALRRRWWAARGAGAFVREGEQAPRALRVSGIAALADAQVCYGGLVHWETVGRLENLLALMRSAWRSRGFGDFWQYMLVAEGAAEVACDVEVSLWDLAAPSVIVEEAGGRVTDLRGARDLAAGSGVATNGLLHEAARAILGS